MSFYDYIRAPGEWLGDQYVYWFVRDARREAAMMAPAASTQSERNTQSTEAAAYNAEIQASVIRAVENVQPVMPYAHNIIGAVDSQYIPQELRTQAASTVEERVEQSRIANTLTADTIGAAQNMRSGGVAGTAIISDLLMGRLIPTSLVSRIPLVGRAPIVGSVLGSVGIERGINAITPEINLTSPARRGFGVPNPESPESVGGTAETYTSAPTSAATALGNAEEESPPSLLKRVARVIARSIRAIQATLFPETQQMPSMDNSDNSDRGRTSSHASTGENGLIAPYTPNTLNNTQAVQR